MTTYNCYWFETKITKTYSSNIIPDSIGNILLYGGGAFNYYLATQLAKQSLKVNILTESDYCIGNSSRFFGGLCYDSSIDRGKQENSFQIIKSLLSLQDIYSQSGTTYLGDKKLFDYSPDTFIFNPFIFSMNLVNKATEMGVASLENGWTYCKNKRFYINNIWNNYDFIVYNPDSYKECFSIGDSFGKILCFVGEIDTRNIIEDYIVKYDDLSYFYYNNKIFGEIKLPQKIVNPTERISQKEIKELARILGSYDLYLKKVEYLWTRTFPCEKDATLSLSFSGNKI